jgi:hypothetical protein
MVEKMMAELAPEKFFFVCVDVLAAAGCGGEVVAFCGRVPHLARAYFAEVEVG